MERGDSVLSALPCERHAYQTDLTGEQWFLLEPLLPPPKKRGHPRTINMREVLNSILYINRAGCQWRMLPKELIPWQTAYGYFRRFRMDGTWERIHTLLREGVRQKAGREKSPSAAILDSQSVKTTEKGGFAGMMQAKKSMGGNGILSSIRWAFFWLLWYMQQTYRTETAPDWSWTS
jgi:putative transposase